ncbi:MAG: hypothetical protein QOI04_100 [Verrucomicrobiota bacterium]
MRSVFRRYTIAIALLGATVATVHAQKVSFPKESPIFSLIAPGGWKAEFQKDNLTLLPDPDDGYFLQINAQPYSAAEALPHIADAIAEQLKLSNLVLGTPLTGPNRHAVKCTLMTARGKSQSGEMVITLAAFSFNQDKYFTVQGIGTSALEQKHGRETRAIVDSIAPIEGH